MTKKPPKPALGDEQIEQQHYTKMNHVARFLDGLFNGSKKRSDRDFGFVLLVFPYGEKEGRCNYISNGANRHDVEKLLYEQAERFKKDREKKSV